MSKETSLLHPKEWILVVILLIAACICRLWIAVSDRNDETHGHLSPGKMFRHQDELAGFLLSKCRFDLGAFCRVPSQWDDLSKSSHNELSSADFTLVYLSNNEESECHDETWSVVPHPFLTMNLNFVRQSCVSSAEGLTKLLNASTYNSNNDKERELVRKFMDVSISHLASTDMFRATNTRQQQAPPLSLSQRRHATTYTREGIPWQPLPSSLEENPDTLKQILQIMMTATIDVLVTNNNTATTTRTTNTEKNHESFSTLDNGILYLLPAQSVLPRGMFAHDEVVAMLKTATHHFAQRRPGDVGFVRLLQSVLDELSSTQSRDETAGPLFKDSEASSATTTDTLLVPPVPFKYGAQISQCFQNMYIQESLVSGSCPAAIRFASHKMQELEFRLDFPLAATLKWIYIVLAVMGLSRLGDQLGEGETERQRSRRHFIQTLEDPLLRKDIEQQAVKEKGEEGAASFMADLDKKVALFRSETSVDEEWKKQERIATAWRQRLVFMNGIRAACAVLLVMSLVLLRVDGAESGAVVEGVLVVLSTFLGTYCCLPRPPSERSNKRCSDLEEPLLLSDTRS